MSNEKEKKTRSKFTASCIKNPFSKLKLQSRNVHTMNGDLLIGDDFGASGKPGGKKPPGESNVSKILKLIPGLCQMKKRPPESSFRSFHRCGSSNTKTQLNDEGIIIDVSPPHKKVISCKVGNRQTESTTSQNRQNPKIIFSNNHPRLNMNNNCLNVKVFGPIYTIVGDMMESNIKKVVTLSGAGMSTSAGIPDFRSSNSGIYDKLKEYDMPYFQAIFERKYFDKNPKPLFGLLKEMLAKDYKPTVAHYFVKLLEEKGILLKHITQNVDGLERLAGVSENKLVEAHGSVYGSRCLKCKTEYDLQWLRDRLVVQGKKIPQCQVPHCLGMVKPNIVLFGESLNSRFMASVKKDIPKCDLLIVIGTSLVVEPFASTVKKVSRICPRIIINNVPVGEHLGIAYEDSKEFNRRKKKSSSRDVFIQGSCDEGVMHLAKLFKWESDLESLIIRSKPTVMPPQAPTPTSKDGNSRMERSHVQNRIKGQSKTPSNDKR